MAEAAAEAAAEAVAEAAAEAAGEGAVRRRPPLPPRLLAWLRAEELLSDAGRVFCRTAGGGAAAAAAGCGSSDGAAMVVAAMAVAAVDAVVLAFGTEQLRVDTEAAGRRGRGNCPPPTLFTVATLGPAAEPGVAEAGAARPA